MSGDFAAISDYLARAIQKYGRAAPNSSRAKSMLVHILKYVRVEHVSAFRSAYTARSYLAVAPRDMLGVIASCLSMDPLYMHSFDAELAGAPLDFNCGVPNSPNGAAAGYDEDGDVSRIDYIINGYHVLELDTSGSHAIRRNGYLHDIPPPGERIAAAVQFMMQNVAAFIGYAPPVASKVSAIIDGESVIGFKLQYYMHGMIYAQTVMRSMGDSDEERMALKQCTITTQYFTTPPHNIPTAHDPAHLTVEQKLQIFGKH